jgi:hypothetical protein
MKRSGVMAMTAGMESRAKMISAHISARDAKNRGEKSFEKMN